MANKKLVVILDPAHGEEVAGKRSPDGRHREYLWSRNVCKLLGEKLESLGYKVAYTTVGNTEPGLTNRKNFATNYKVEEGETKFLLSLHNNAAGSGADWMTARGFENYAYSLTGKSAEYGKVILDSVAKAFPDFKNRGMKAANFTVITGSGYNANLFEWLFQDNKEDVAILEDANSNNKLVNALAEAIGIINDKL